MFRVEQTAELSEWRDERAQLKIAQRIMRLQGGNPGDWKSLGGGLSEMRIDYGPGYRCYYTIRERVICLLLCGSDKRDQDRAIRRARALLKKIE